MKKSKNVYVVNVGNVGNIECKNKVEAVNTFAEYVKQSKSDYGRPSGEDVTLFINDEIAKEYIGTLSENNL